MPKKIDLTGQRFGKLVALYRNGSTDKGLAIWHCQCDCGNECDKVGVYLREGSTKSCGCSTGEFIGASSRKYNEYDFTNNFGIGYTSAKHKPFYFDLEDYDKIKDYCWNIDRCGYIVAKTHDGRNNTILMHNIICGQKYVDHIGGANTRNDNRKCNLRIFDNTYSFETYNNINKKIQKNNKSGCPGVSWHSRDQIWEVHLSIDNQLLYLGRFTKLEDAIKCRKQAEEKYFGEYSYDNSQELAKNFKEEF